jgi:phosphocarrier protein
MKEFSYTVANEHGMHARPCGLLAATAKKYSSSIKAFYNGKDADCKRLIALMELGIKYGGTVHFRVDGDDEGEASNAILKCLTENVG